MNNIELGMAALSIFLIMWWLMTPSYRVMDDQEMVRREAEAFDKALKEKWLAQQKKHGERVEARQKQMLYDPPSGWRYGFPRPYLPLEGETLRETLLRDGYPATELDSITREDGSLYGVRFIG